MSWNELRTSYRDSLWQLAQFERGIAYLRAGVGALIFLLVLAVPLAVLYGSVYMAETREAQLALDALLILTTTAAGRVWKRRLWERPVSSRLTRWQAYDPEIAEVGVAIAGTDIQRACVALMHAHLYPKFSRRSNSIPDAPTLDNYLAVVLPSTVPQVEFEQVAEMTRDSLRRAGIRARVVGIDVP